MVRTLLVIVVVVVLGTRTPVVQMVHPGAWLAIAAVPFWWGATRHFRGGRLLIYVTAAMVLGGIWLTELAKSSHRISNDLLFSNSLTIVAIAAMIGMFLWMRTFTPEWLLTFAFGVGMLATVVITRQGLDVNPWKFALLYPVALIVMSLAQRFGGLALQALAAAVIGGISAAQDSRSALGLLALTAMLLIFQLKPQHPTRRKSALRTVVGLGLAAVVVFQLGQAAVLEGALGEATQERSQLQVEQSGSLLLGSRPEAAASFALLTARPIGYGSGTLPNLTDVLTAKTEQTKIGYDPDNGYVERYMFGSGYEVHSVLADYWLRYGLAGLAMALLIAALIVRGLAQRIAESNASGVAIYAGAQTLWALLFAPTFASAPLLVIAVMTLLLPKPRRRLATPSSTRPLDRVP